jgi:hypothetical protein
VIGGLHPSAVKNTKLLCPPGGCHKLSKVYIFEKMRDPWFAKLMKQVPGGGRRRAFSLFVDM